MPCSNVTVRLKREFCFCLKLKVVLDYGDDGQRTQKCVKNAVSEGRGLTRTILPEFQPDNEVWTLFWQYGLRIACKDFNRTTNFGHRLHKGNEEGGKGVYWDEEAKEAFLVAFRARLLGLFGRLLSFIEDNSFSLRKRRSRFFSSSSGLWCNALSFFSNSGFFFFFEETKSLTTLNTLMLWSVF